MIFLSWGNYSRLPFNWTELYTQVYIYIYRKKKVEKERASEQANNLRKICIHLFPTKAIDKIVQH